MVARQSRDRQIVIEQLVRVLAGAVGGSRAGGRGSLERDRGDLYSDIDLRWVVPDERFAQVLEVLPGIVAQVGPVQALRFDPDLQRSDRRRLVFVAYAHLPLFWRVDLDVHTWSVTRDEHYDEGNPAARGDDWSWPASALANAAATVKALNRGQPHRARGLLDRGYERLGSRRNTDDWADAIGGLVERAVSLEPAQAGMAERVRALVAAELAGDR